MLNPSNKLSVSAILQIPTRAIMLKIINTIILLLIQMEIWLLNYKNIMAIVITIIPITRGIANEALNEVNSCGGNE
mgnify:CR=1 FL=1